MGKQAESHICLPCKNGRKSAKHIQSPSSLKTKNDASANSVDPDETAHNEPSHQDLHCLSFFYHFRLKPLFATMDMSKFIEESMLEKGVKGLILFFLIRYTFASGSPDNIKQWKFPDGNFLQNLSGHNAIINSLALNSDNVLVSGGRYIYICSKTSVTQNTNGSLTVMIQTFFKSFIGDSSDC